MPVITIKVKDIDWNVHDLILDSDENKSIVDLAEDQWIELPSSCRSGACFSCCGEVKQGKEYMDNNKTGQQLIDVEENETLCCVSWVCSKAFDTPEDKTIEIEMLN